MATFARMRENLRLLTMGGLGKALATGDTYGAIVNRVYESLFEDYDWSYRLSNTVINSVAPKTAGTVTLAAGSPQVIGTGTNFTVADRGAFLWVGGLSITPLPILDVQGTEMLSLTNPYSGPTVINTSYVLAPLYYVVEGALEVLSIRCNQIEVGKRLREEINDLDPTRTSQGGTPSQLWCPAPPSPDGSVMVELWPVPGDARGYLVDFRCKIKPLVNDDDRPILPSIVVEEAAAIMACEMLFAARGERAWIELANVHRVNLYGDPGNPAGDPGHLFRALDRDKARREYLDRLTNPETPTFPGGYRADFTPTHPIQDF